MKAKNLLKKAFLLLALVGGATNAWGDKVSISMNSSKNWTYSSAGSGISVTSPSKSSGSSYHQINNGAITITAETGKTITGISLTFSRINTVTIKADDAAAVTYSNSWTGSAQTIVIADGASSSQARISSIDVTYTTGGGGKTASSCAFATANPGINFPATSTYTQAATTAAGYDGTVAYELSNNTCGATIEGTTVTVTQAGSVNVTATAPETENYASSSASYTLTVTDPRTALTGAWSNAAPSFNVGASATIPTFDVTGGGTLGTDYTVAYSVVSGTLATVNASTGITAINTEAAGTATVKATVTVVNTADYKMATTSYDCAISVVNGACAVPSYAVDQYDYEQGGFKVTFTCATEGATLKYVLTNDNPNDGSQSTYFDGEHGTIYTYTEPIYIKGTRVIIQASKDDYTTSYSTKGTRYQTSDAPTGTSPEVIGWNVKGNSDGEKNADHGNRAVTIGGGHYAQGNISFANPNGLKLRLAPNSTSSGIDGVSLFMKMDVKTGYKVTKVKFDKIKENSDKGGLTINNVYVDGVALAGFEAISIPKSSEDILENTEIDLSGATNGGATSNVVISFARTDNNTTQYNAVTTVTYVPTTVSGTITPAGWSTFSSEYPLDLNNITGGEAYYASTSGETSVTLTPTTAKVPANTGLMIKGTAGAEFTIATTSDETTAIDGNLLKGHTITGTVDASPVSGPGTYHYVFGYESSSVYGFYNLAEATTVPAGKAYLEITKLAQGARSLRISLGDITEVENVEAAPVATVKKNGAYLENGKIAIYKNGMKFNANGQLIK